MKNILIILFLAVACKATGQQLQVGDKIPDYIFQQMLYYPKEQASIKDFRGKLLLLDFWFTGCTVCLQQFPKLEQLQQQFGDSLMILPVGFDLTAEGSIKALVDKRKGTTRAINLPVAVQAPQDSTLLRWFPTDGYPHEVWIDSSGTVTGITEQNGVTAENISRLLHGQQVPFNRYIIQHRITGREPFLVKGYGSIFTGYIDTLTTSTSFDRQFDSSYIKLFEVNQTVFGMYLDAYRDNVVNNWKRVVVENAGNSFYKDAHELTTGSNWDWDNFNRQSLFNYELVLPRSYTLAGAYKRMISDLDQHFGVTSNIGKRKMKCLTLVTTGKLPMSIAEQSYNQMEDGQEMHMKNTRMANLVNFLDNLVNRIIVDETGYHGGLDMDIILEKNYTLHDINRALQKYHMALQETQRELEVLVIRKNQ